MWFQIGLRSANETIYPGPHSSNLMTVVMLVGEARGKASEGAGELGSVACGFVEQPLGENRLALASARAETRT
jgi:hypothetical protein